MSAHVYDFRDPTRPGNGACKLVIEVNPDGIQFGVQHATPDGKHDCPELADITVTLDAFVCSKCYRSGRISGAWAEEQLYLALDRGEFSPPVNPNGEAES